MVDFKIGTDTAGPYVKRLAKELRSKGFERGVVAGLNRTAQHGMTVAVRAIQVDTGASAQKTIRRSLKVDGATAAKPQARLIARSGKKERIPIYELKPSPSSVAKRRRSVAGISYGPLRRLLKSSFIARMPSGHTGVFKRLGNRSSTRDTNMVSVGSGVFQAASFLTRRRRSARQAIGELFGPSVALVFGRRKVASQIEKAIDETLPKELDRAIAHFTRTGT